MTGAGWRVLGASVAGTSHRRHEVPCQDAHAYRIMPDGALLVAVADGAGSAARAEEGARLAVERAVGRLAAALSPPASDADWFEAMHGAFTAAREALEEAALGAGEDLGDYAATLTCAVATADCLVVGQIGDGVAVARGGAGALFTTIRPRRGEYANETRFLTMPGALGQVEVAVFPRPVGALAVTTDGLLRLAVTLPGYEPHPPFFRPLLAFAAEVEEIAAAEAELAAFLASDRVGARTDDDKTLVLAVRTPVTAIAPPVAP